MAAGVITRSAHPDALWPGIRAWFGMSYESVPLTYTQIFEQLAKSMRTTTEYVHANVFNRGFDSAYPIGDGQPLFSASHPTTSGPQSNLLTAADISEAAVEDATKAVWRIQDDRGFPTNSGIRRLIINSDDAFAATRILNSVLRSGTNNNDINALNAMGIVPEVVVDKYLTDTDSWYVQTDIDNGLQTYWRNKTEVERDNDFDTYNAKTKAYMRFSAGCADWRQVFGNTGA